jgi:hypothetical protein
VYQNIRQAGLLFLLATAAGGPSLAHAGWTDERQVDGLVCHADFPLDNYAGLLREVSRLHGEIRQTLGLPSPRSPVHIFMFHDESAYRAYMKRWFPSVPQRRALFIKHEGPGMVFTYRGRHLVTDLRHESTHALLHSCLPSVPLWLDEGLAEYFELPADQRAGGNPYLKGTTWNARLGAVPSLQRLEQLSDINQMGQRQYRDAWAWVHFLLHASPEGKAELTAYIASIARGGPPGKLSERLTRSLGKPAKHFAAHFRTWKR